MAAVARSLPQMLPMSAAASSEGGDSPIFYPLDTPNVGAPLIKQEGDQPSRTRNGSIDEGYRRFVRASSDPAGVTPGPKDSGKLDNEPNPFEQSFRNPSERNSRRARSQSPKSARATPLIGSGVNGGKMQGATSDSPTADAGFSWNLHSLRSGGLTPSMLTGPSGTTGIFDPASMRTGLTPSIGGGHPWGPDTPGGTSAFFASLAGSTPDLARTLGTTMAGVTATSRTEPANHFDSTFARAISQPNVTNNGMHSHLANHNFAQQSAPRPMVTQAYSMPTSQPSLAGAFGANPLYLLSHGVSEHELAGVADDDVMAAAALSNLQTTPIATYHTATTVPPSQTVAAPSNGASHDDPPNAAKSSRNRQSTNGSLNGGVSSPASSASPGKKRKSDGESSAKRTSGRGKKAKVLHDDDEDAFDDDDDMYLEEPELRSSGASRGRTSKRNETDEDKRKNFLERNRQAALKCRQRKKQWLNSLQSKVEYLTADNETLQSTVNSLREEIAALRAVLVAHKDCPVTMPKGQQTTVGAVLSQQNGHNTRYG